MMDNFLRPDDGSGISVLFVCTGNTCRSPLAEYCLKYLSDEKIRTASAGLHAFEGEAMNKNSLTVLAENGIDGSRFRSRNVAFDMTARASLILTMTRMQKLELITRFPQAADKCRLLAEISGGGEIPDPFGGSLEIYRQTWEKIRQNVEIWLAALTRR